MPLLIYCAAIVVFLTCPAGAAQAVMDVYAGAFDSITIGIVNFRESGGSERTRLPCLPWTVVANDFDLCGRFHVVRAAVADSEVFAEEGAGIYVDGEYSVAGGRATVTYFLRDITAEEPLFERKYASDTAAVRMAAHRFAGEVYELIYGRAGIFTSRLLFVSTAGGAKNVGIMDFDGGARRMITKGSDLNLFPAFVDSARMLCTSYSQGRPVVCLALITDGRAGIFTESGGIEVSPAVSPIDGAVAFASSRGGSLDIYTCASDGSGRRRLTSGSGVETAPCWSPNGYHIAYVSDQSGNPNIYVMDADGANHRRITFSSRYCDSPDWSPDGSQIAFTSMGENGKLDIWVVSPDGSDEKRLTDFPGDHEYPTWSPDGMLIGFVSRSGVKSDFYVMRHDGGRVKQVTSSGDVIMPDWGK
ncbi:MAG: PD40 domain-containing protein [Chitinispirillaceae bacterium]|nr:PD40 domain-containing protein [Chitinispirillaceae bacterium]